MMRNKLFMQFFLGLVVGVLFSASTVYGDCSCLRGNNDIYVIGFEIVSKFCPQNPYTDSDNYAYVYTEINCSGSMTIPGSVIPFNTTQEDEYDNPSDRIEDFTDAGHKVIRNPSGTHILVIRGDIDPANRFSGIIAGVNIDWSDGISVYETDQKDRFNEYCTGSYFVDHLFVLDTDKFPDCLDCVPNDPNYGVCLKEENNLGPCPEPPQSGINTSL